MDCVTKFLGPVVKWSSRRPVKPEVAGSNPVGTANRTAARRFCVHEVPSGGSCRGRVAQSAEHTPEKRGVRGSTPRSTTSYQPSRHAGAEIRFRAERLLDQAAIRIGSGTLTLTRSPPPVYILSTLPSHSFRSARSVVRSIQLA